MDISIDNSTDAEDLFTNWHRWPGLKWLSLRNIHLEHYAELIPEARWTELETLHIYSAFLGEAGAQALAKAAPHWPKLTNLIFSGMYVDPEEIHELMEVHWPFLKEISFSNADINSRGGKAIAKAGKRCPALKKLDLTKNYLGDKGLRAILAADFLNLEEIRLRDNEIGDDGVRFLGLNADRLPKLKSLMLDGNFLWDDALEGLARANWPYLETLWLGKHSHFSSRGYAALARGSALWPRLKTLDLSECDMNAEHLEALLGGNWKSLEILILKFNELEEEGGVVLAAAAGRLPSLKRLCLTLTYLRQSGFEALLSARWPMLEELILCDSCFGPRIVAALGAAIRDDRLPSLKSFELPYKGAIHLETILEYPWKNLKKLTVGNSTSSRNGPAVHDVLAKVSDKLPALQTLELRGSSAESVLTILEAHWASLKALEWRSGDLEDLELPPHLAAKWTVQRRKVVRVEDALLEGTAI